MWHFFLLWWWGGVGSECLKRAYQKMLALELYHVSSLSETPHSQMPGAPAITFWRTTLFSPHIFHGILHFWKLLLTILNTNTNKNNKATTTTMTTGGLTTLKIINGMGWLHALPLYYYCSSSTQCPTPHHSDLSVGDRTNLLDGILLTIMFILPLYCSSS
jgi:hypothetical protein